MANKNPEIKLSETKPTVDEVTEELKRLGAGLIAVADQAEARTAKIHEIEEFFGKLSLRDFADLAESEVVQNFVKLFENTAGMAPGETRKRGTLAEVRKEWSIRDLAQFPLSPRFVPNETIPITWNGITVYLQEDVECQVPIPFYDIYREHRRALRQAALHEQYLMDMSDTPPDSNWLTPESAKVRAMSQLGRPYKKPGGSISVGALRPDAPVAPGNVPSGLPETEGVA